MLIPSDYQRVFKQGKKQRGNLFAIISCANGFSCARLGLAIAKRHIPLAVDRNRVRRIIRESFRLYQSALKGVDIVVTAQKALHQMSNTSLHEELNQQWRILVGHLKISY